MRLVVAVRGRVRARGTRGTWTRSVRNARGHFANVGSRSIELSALKW